MVIICPYLSVTVGLVGICWYLLVGSVSVGFVGICSKSRPHATSFRKCSAPRKL